MLYNRIVLLSTLLGMASAVDYSGKPSSTKTKNNINIDSIRRRAKSGKGGKSGGGSGDDWHSSGDIEYTGRFSGSAKATSAQVTNLNELIDGMNKDTGLTLGLELRRLQIYIGSSIQDSHQ